MVWRDLARFTFKRVLSMAVVLVLITTFAFFVTRKLGTPMYLMVGQEYTKEMLDSAKERLGIDKPIVTQYLTYTRAVLRGDLGISRFTHNPVVVDLMLRLPATMELALAALLIALVISILAGMFVAFARKKNILSRFLNLMAALGVSVAQPWLALLFIYIFFSELHLAPAPMGRIGTAIDPPGMITGFYMIDSILTGNLSALFSSAAHLALPVAVLVFTTFAPMMRLIRADASHILRSGYIQNARAFGLRTRTISWYTFKNLVPTLSTLTAMNLAWLISADIVVEVIFSWPGLGLYVVNSMDNSDYNPVIAVVMFAAILYAVLYYVSDMVSTFVDPRWRKALEKQGG